MSEDELKQLEWRISQSFLASERRDLIRKAVSKARDGALEEAASAVETFTAGSSYRMRDGLAAAVRSLKSGGA